MITAFDWLSNPKLPRQPCFELHTLSFIADGGNVLIIGKPGVGKPYVAKAVAYLPSEPSVKLRRPRWA